ncbi:hypothetical protein D3273_17765 [Lichenibacterium minor]|uniref:Uncharacterized protein n=1 Tax=Lichenibacterium minor TaxID=2316528 RepID=A0A4Q2U6I0_9HYPH|nr:hypothetical protein [Lichenibacterium minor]RYC30691.1 hypothetical protein D3273_17765 [Lichenibacterium minor]
MADNNGAGAVALIAAGAIAMVAGFMVVDKAHAEGVVRRPVAGAQAGRGRVAARPRAVRTAAAERPLTIRRRAARGPVDVVGDGFYGDDYLVRQHSWNDPRLYYFGPFRTGGETFYGDQAGNPITRGNAGLGQIAGYGAARGGFGGPHFDAVGGFHQGPGPDAKIDGDFASGSLSRPYYGDIEPRYPSVTDRVASLNGGVVSRPSGVTNGALDRAESRRVMSEGGATTASFAQAKADFAAPMKRQAPIEAGFANGGIRSIGIDDGAF